jgi:hypothetical protein
MAKWHKVAAGRFDETQDDRDFVEQGPLVSIGREPPQNSTDNPLDKDAPVRLRYSFRTVPMTEEIRDRYLPNNPWVDHITCPQNDEITDYGPSGSNLIDEISDSVEVLLVEDYNATGLVGDAYKLFPNTPDRDGNLDQESMDNTFFWFMRSTGADRPTRGRGGSWGLGKLAFPLASSARTFFVVTTRSDQKRYLAGQAILKNHNFRGKWWAAMMYFADDELIGEDKHHWAPVSDQNEIDEFCSVFQVERGGDVPGTSVVVPLPKEDLNVGDLALCILSNYCVPIMEGRLTVEFSKSEGHTLEINSSNIRRALSSDEMRWDRLNRNLPDNAGVNPAWTTRGRMAELVLLHESMRGDGVEYTELPVGAPEPSRAPNSNEQFNAILPDRGTSELDAVSDAFQENGVIHVEGQIPVHQRGNGVEFGSYKLVLRKCEDPDDAEAHFYRDQISLPLVLKKEPAVDGVSSLLKVSGDHNPLKELLRQAEGPAHLNWNPRSVRMKRGYEYGPTTIYFLRDLVKKIVNKITSVQIEAESIWDEFFSLGEDKPKPPKIIRNFRIDEKEHGGFTITPLEEAEDLSGKQYVIRVGYPKPATAMPKSPPDPRAINVHEMNWWGDGATVSFDVLADNGEVCRDRVLVAISEPDFEIHLEGLDTELKAQAIVTERDSQ